MRRRPLSKIRIIFLVLVVTLVAAYFLRDFSDGNSSLQEQNRVLRTAQSKAPVANLAPGKANSIAIVNGNPVPSSIKFSNESDLCKNFVTDRSGKLDPFQFLDGLQSYLQTSDHSVEEWLRIVASNGLPRQRGAALSLLLAGEVKAVTKQVYDKNPNCDDNNQCSESLGAGIVERTHMDLMTLLDLAIYGSDPMLYGMAHNVCFSGPFNAINLCARIGTAQWLQRDPDNGAAAMYALDEVKVPALGEGSTAIENALYRLSLSKRFDHYTDVVGELPPVPENLDDYQHKTELAALAYEHVMRMPIPPRKNILAACNDGGVMQAQRRLICTSIANQLLRDNASLFDRAAFMQLSRHLDWDKEKLQRITDDFDLARAYFREIMRREAQQVQQSSGQVTACHMNLKQMDRTLKSLRSGDFAMYLEDAKTFDIPREELIKMGRRMRSTK